MNARPRVVCLMAGFVPSGASKHRAVCTCGWSTSPRVTRQRALDALDTEHGVTRAQCACCGTDYSDLDWQKRRNALEILEDSLDGQFLSCRGAPQRCQEEAARRVRAAEDRFAAATAQLDELAERRARRHGRKQRSGSSPPAR